MATATKKRVKRKVGSSTTTLTDCTYAKNPASGYGASHTAMCYCCPKEAKGHVQTPFKWCGNACEVHLKALGDKHRGSVVSNKIVVVDIKGEL